jgi:GxxExxY protein
MTHNEITHTIVDTAMHIHRSLGPGLLESVYLAVMAHELKKKGLRVATEVPVPVQWQEMTLELGFRADMIVEDMVIVELKSVEKISPVHKKQLLTYLKVTDKRLGLLINFGEDLLSNGIIRVVNGLRE